MATDVERLVVLLEANAENLRRQMRGAEQVVDRSTNRMERNLRTLRNAFYAITAALAGGGLIASTVRLADSYRSLDNRLRLVTGSEEERTALMRELLELSNETRTSLEGTTTVFFRLSRGLERYGIEGERLIGILRTINQTVAISGATAAEAEGALIQFSQALNTDFQSAGQEIRSLQEQMPALVSAIEDGMGIARGSFVQMARSGEVSTEQVIAAIERVAGSINTEFSQTTSTVGQAVKNMNDAILAAVGAFDQASGASGGFATAIDSLADRIIENLPYFERLGAALAPAASAMSGVLGGMGGLPNMSSTTGGGGGWGDPQAPATTPPPAPGTPSDGDIENTRTFLDLNRFVTQALEEQLAAQQMLKDNLGWIAEKEAEILDVVKQVSMKEDEAAQRMQDNLQRTVDGFLGAIQGAKDFEDALKRVVLQMIRMALLSDTGQSFLSNIFSNTIGSFFGGGGSVPGKALGGPVAGGKAYLVGEHRPEIFVPPAGGGFINNGRGGAGGGLTVSFNVDARGAQMGVAEQIQAMFPQMVRTIKAEIRNDASRGGAFAASLGSA